jgi:hypothetical protein
VTARSPIDKTAASRFHRYASVVHGLDRRPGGAEREFTVRSRSQRKLAVRRFPQPARGRGRGRGVHPALAVLLPRAHAAAHRAVGEPGRRRDPGRVRPVPDEAWDGLAAEARALVAFLADRDPAVYRRYGLWWAKLRPGETRLLR